MLPLCFLPCNLFKLLIIFVVLQGPATGSLFVFLLLPESFRRLQCSTFGFSRPLFWVPFGLVFDASEPSHRSQNHTPAVVALLLPPSTTFWPPSGPLLGVPGACAWGIRSKTFGSKLLPGSDCLAVSLYSLRDLVFAPCKGPRRRFLSPAQAYLSVRVCACAYVQTPHAVYTPVTHLRSPFRLSEASSPKTCLLI